MRWLQSGRSWPVPDNEAIRDTPGTTGVWIAVDVGSVRVGVARSDPRGVLAVPVATLARSVADDRDIAELTGLVAEYEAVGVVIGLPRTLAGREGVAAQAEN